MTHKINGGKILAIETSSKVFSLALSESGMIKSEFSLDAGLRHSELLRENCAFLLKQCQWKKEELQGLAVSVGPGSFTGLRVGISFARALAQSLRVPLAGVPAPEIIARGLRSAQPICVIIESAGSEVFTGFFNPGEFLPSENYKIINIDALGAELAKRPLTQCVGEGFLKYEQVIRPSSAARALSIEHRQHFPRAGILAIIADEQLASKKFKRDSWKKVTPYYLRPPMAVERLMKK